MDARAPITDFRQLFREGARGVGLLDEACQSFPGETTDGFDLVEAARQDYRNVRIGFSHVSQGYFAAHDRHGHIQYDSEKLAMAFAEEFNTLATVFCKDHGIPVALQSGMGGSPNNFLVIHDQDGSLTAHIHLRRWRGSDCVRPRRAGSSTLNVLPVPGCE